MSELERTVIIGSGPAGFAAAIYAARANLRPLLFEGTVKPEMIPLGQLASEAETFVFSPTVARTRPATGICLRYPKDTSETGNHTMPSKALN